MRLGDADPGDSSDDASCFEKELHHIAVGGPFPPHCWYYGQSAVIWRVSAAPDPPRPSPSIRHSCACHHTRQLPSLLIDIVTLLSELRWSASRSLRGCSKNCGAEACEDLWGRRVWVYEALIAVGSCSLCVSEAL